MSDVDLVVERCKVLESLLGSKFNAQGRGLQEKVSSVEELLPPALVKSLRYVGKMRNQGVYEEEEFSLPDRDDFIQTCDEAEEWLNQLPENRKVHIGNSASYQSNRSTQPKDFSEFSVPSHLQTFISKSIFGKKLITLWSITGEVAHFREERRRRKENDKVIEWVEQKIWLKLPDSTEQQFEFIDFGIQARSGHVLTLVTAAYREQKEYVAVYNHASRLYFWKLDLLKLFFGELGDLIRIGFGLLTYVVSFFFGLLLSPFVFFPLYSLMQAIIPLSFAPLVLICYFVISTIVIQSLVVNKVYHSPLLKLQKHIEAIVASFPKS